MWRCSLAVLLEICFFFKITTSAPTLIGWWTFDNLLDPTVVSDKSGNKINGILGGSSVKISLGVDNTAACRFFGNTSAGFVIPHNSVLDNIEEVSIAFWINYWWGDVMIAQKEGSYEVEFYRQMIKTELHNSQGKIEWTWYPKDCAYVSPGSWHHIVVAYSKHGHVDLFIDGASCGRYQDTHEGGLVVQKNDLIMGGFSGFLSDIRIYKEPLGQTDVNAIYTPKAQNVYNKTIFQIPTQKEIDERDLGWNNWEKKHPVTINDKTLYQAWLNYKSFPTSIHTNKLQHILLVDEIQSNAQYTNHASIIDILKILKENKHALEKIVSHPVLSTAVNELLTAISPELKSVFLLRSENNSILKFVDRSIVVGTCNSRSIASLVKLSMESGENKINDCETITNEGFILRLIQKEKKILRNTNDSNFLSNDRITILIAGGGPAGVLYGIFSLIRHLQMGKALTPSLLNRIENPSTSIRCINLWSQWRGFPQDSWMSGDGGRSNSIFSWEDLRKGGNATKRMSDWARLLASVGINALAPQDVNWDERNNYLLHLDELPLLGDILRRYAIRLFWTPNYLLAPLQSTADALYDAIPDFGGYLLKIGSEKQGGKPTPTLINVIADCLIRNTTTGQINGTVLLRGFIYGSSFHYPQKNRMAIPAAFFGPYDGQYRNNVHIIGKYSSLDFETAEPINALDGLLKKTKYGTEVVVGKDFMMSWIKNWENWLSFDNQRGPGGGSLLNRDCIDSFVGVAMVKPLPSWEANPLNMINYYGFGRLSWQTNLHTKDIYTEWIRLTFGASLSNVSVILMHQLLNTTEDIANLLGLYHGYRGVWYEFETDGSFRSPTSVNKQQNNKKGAGTPKDIAKELILEYSSGVQSIYTNFSDPRSEKVLLEWEIFPWSYKLLNGRTMIEDAFIRPEEGVNSTLEICNLWEKLKVDVNLTVGFTFYNVTNEQLNIFVQQAQTQASRIHNAFSKF